MKKISLVLCIALASCSKESPKEMGEAVIEYDYSAPVSGSYSITYTDANNNPATITFTSTSWSKVITTYPLSGLETANFEVMVTSSSLQTTGTMIIKINGKVASQQNDAIDTGSGKIDFTSFAVVFTNTSV